MAVSSKPSRYVEPSARPTGITREEKLCCGQQAFVSSGLLLNRRVSGDFHQAAPGFWAVLSPQGPVLRDAAWDSKGMVGSGSRAARSPWTALG